MSETADLPGAEQPEAPLLELELGDVQADPEQAPAPPAACPVAEEAADLMPEVPPISIERLPPNFRKHADPKSPLPLRGMAAKGLVPLSPQDMCLCLALLAHDPDPGVAAAAR
ncbi:MAG: hypothetical protein HY901_25610, partial [Deltaproteobacteria bacterium]|nr:hypothetical protein [Deltaproteobacteria bacterium]